MLLPRDTHFRVSLRTRSYILIGSEHARDEADIAD
jgi:hypothetical protein